MRKVRPISKVNERDVIKIRHCSFFYEESVDFEPNTKIMFVLVGEKDLLGHSRRCYFRVKTCGTPPMIFSNTILLGDGDTKISRSSQFGRLLVELSKFGVIIKSSKASDLVGLKMELNCDDRDNPVVYRVYREDRK